MAEERSLGGNLNDAVRIGDTVHRRAGPWTPSVHALLRFLEREGFDALDLRLALPGLGIDATKMLDHANFVRP